MNNKSQNWKRYLIAGLLVIAAAMFFMPLFSYMDESISMNSVVNGLGKLQEASGFVEEMLGIEDDYGVMQSLASLRYILCIPFGVALVMALVNVFVPGWLGRLATVIVGILNIVLVMGVVTLGQSQLEELLNELLEEFFYDLDMVDFNLWGILGIGFWGFVVFQLVAVIFSVVLMGEKGSVGIEPAEREFVSEKKEELEKESPELEESTEGILRGLNGEYAGMQLPILKGETVVIGRDGRVCNLVLTNPKISRRHCSVSYFPETNRYALTDFSSTGTFYGSGKRVQTNSTVELMAGTEISLGDRQNTFRLG